jgi:hypothetical protein
LPELLPELPVEEPLERVLPPDEERLTLELLLLEEDGLLTLEDELLLLEAGLLVLEDEEDGSRLTLRVEEVPAELSERVITELFELSEVERLSVEVLPLAL